MILFKTVRWRNFLSTGDKFTEIKLHEAPTTLIVGPNGSGKSTLLDALSFALFGKPHRDINKPQMVNSINNRDCEVEVEFSINSTEYVVRRGLKPGIFEIYQNGNLLNQESHSRDYQRVLEQNILKLNHKSFHQIVVLGSSSFVPFMQLPSSTRREVIEDLLDINIFTKMNQILKEKSALLREQLGQANHETELVKEKIVMQQKYIKDLKAKDQEHAQKNQEIINDLEKQVQDLINVNTELQTGISEKQSEAKQRLSKAQDKRNTLHTYKIQIESNISGVIKEAKFYEEHNECPTCAQSIDTGFKNKRIHSCKSRAKDLNEGRSKLAEELQKIETELNSAGSILTECNDRQSQCQANLLTISSLQKQIVSLEKEQLEKKTDDIDAAEKTLEDMKAQGDELNSLRSKYYEEGTYNQVIAELLKDTGIKTKVIRQYLPVMNKLVNQYLQTLDFFVSFTLDESFNEIIRSRHRDEFSYASFSEGEKMKIDLSLLFTWRQIARMKNSVSTNLLILDETFDSSLDGEGTENLLKIFTTLDNETNVFVISHRKELMESSKFLRGIQFEKINGFSKLKHTFE